MNLYLPLFRRAPQVKCAPRRADPFCVGVESEPY